MYKMETMTQKSTHNSFDKFKNHDYNKASFDRSYVFEGVRNIENANRKIRIREAKGCVDYAYTPPHEHSLSKERQDPKSYIFINLQKALHFSNRPKLLKKLIEEPSEELLSLRKIREKIGAIMVIANEANEEAKLSYKNQTIRLNKEYHERFPNGNKILNPDVWGHIKSFGWEVPPKKEFRKTRWCYTGGLYRIVIKNGTEGWNFDHTKSDYLIKLDVHEDFNVTMDATISFYKDAGGGCMKLIEHTRKKRMKKGRDKVEDNYINGKTFEDFTFKHKLLTNGSITIKFPDCRYYGKKDDWGSLTFLYAHFIDPALI